MTLLYLHEVINDIIMVVCTLTWRCVTGRPNVVALTLMPLLY